MKEKIIFAITVSLLVFPTAFAVINAQSCYVNNCPLSVFDCATGTIDIYSSQGCTGNPLFEYTFTGNSLAWFPASAGTYYMMAFCDDVAHTKSICSTVPVLQSSANTSTPTETPSQSQPLPTGIPTTPSGGGSNTIFYVLIVVIIAVVAFIAYRLLGRKKKPKVDYESLYKKWGR